VGAAWYEPLPASDRSFLVFEDQHTHMHLGGITLFEPGPLGLPGGGVAIDRIREHIASRLHLRPRYRQRLASVPIRNRPIWVDDPHFNLSYHVRHAAVPHPGDDVQLKQLCARIVSQQLDRGKPLWEIWVIEGLGGGRFAMLVKTHHCMADGISAFDLFTALVSPTPDDSLDAPAPWTPRPAPGPMRLLADELLRQAGTPFEIASALVNALRDPARGRALVAENLRGLWSTIQNGIRPPSPTPLNGPIGPHRRFDWLTLDLGEVKRVRQRLGGTVNDVVLATVAGAVRTFLRRRGVPSDEIFFRAVVPVSVRSENERGVQNNRVSGWLTELPVDEPDPLRRLERVKEVTTRLKTSKQALGPELLGRAAEWATPGVLTVGVRLTARLHPYNVIVTNVPGPPMPLYLLGARLLGGYPLVPLFENQGIGIALFSYVGQLCWGFNADWDLVPDLGRFVEAVRESFGELTAAADADPIPAAVGG